ncbi:hypothetical protein NDU88_000527, partial [Pleurodeles waltl]
PTPVRGQFSPPSLQPQSSNEESGSHPTSRPSFTTTACLAPEFRAFQDMNIDQECRLILSRARAESTNKTYKLKWKRFCVWCSQNNFHPFQINPDEILS